MFTTNDFSDLFFNFAPAEQAYNEHHTGNDLKSALTLVASEFINMLPLTVSFSEIELAEDFLDRV